MSELQRRETFAWILVLGLRHKRPNMKGSSSNAGDLIEDGRQRVLETLRTEKLPRRFALNLDKIFSGSESLGLRNRTQPRNGHRSRHINTETRCSFIRKLSPKAVVYWSIAFPFDKWKAGRASWQVFCQLLDATSEALDCPPFVYERMKYLETQVDRRQDFQAMLCRIRSTTATAPTFLAGATSETPGLSIEAQTPIASSNPGCASSFSGPFHFRWENYFHFNSVTRAQCQQLPAVLKEPVMSSKAWREAEARQDVYTDALSFYLPHRFGNDAFMIIRMHPDQSIALIEKMKNQSST